MGSMQGYVPAILDIVAVGAIARRARAGLRRVVVFRLGGLRCTGGDERDADGENASAEARGHTDLPV